MESGKQGILQFPWTENREIANTVHDLATQFTSRELAARYSFLKDELEKEYRRVRMECLFNEFRYDWDDLLVSKETIETVAEPIKTESFLEIMRVPSRFFFREPIELEWFFPPGYERQQAEDLLLGVGEVCEQPRPALPKTRRRRDPPPRVSRRSSQVSQPIYQRHRFLPQSRKQSSSRRQR